jgi:hypothetical protein
VLEWHVTRSWVGSVVCMKSGLPPRFWLLHAAFAVGSGTVFVLFKVLLSLYLLNGPTEKAKEA